MPLFFRGISKCLYFFDASIFQQRWKSDGRLARRKNFLRRKVTPTITIYVTVEHSTSSTGACARLSKESITLPSIDKKKHKSKVNNNNIHNTNNNNTFNILKMIVMLHYEAVDAYHHLPHTLY
jgi:hypothetical protein